MDALEYMRGLPDKSVDLVLCDPPYGIGESKNAKSRIKRIGLKGPNSKAATEVRDYYCGDWDNERLGAEYINEILRVSVNQVVFGGNYYADLLPASTCWIVWDKINGENSFADCELAWTSFTSAVRKIEYIWNSMLQGDMKNKQQRIHPTEKPIPVLAWILRKYSEPGMTVLDPFMGSGTTAIACIQEGRNFIGTELDPVYFAMASKRIAQEQAKLKLF